MRNSSPSRRGQQKYVRSNEGFRIDSPRSKDDDLALFHNMRAHENKNFLQLSSDDIDASLSTKLGGLTGFRISASQTPPWKGNDLLATADTEKNDYDWLLTPPGTPLFPSLDKDSLQSYMDRGVLTQPYPVSKISRLSGPHTSELGRTFSRRSPGPRTPTSTVSSTTSTYSASRSRASSPSRANSSPTLRPASPAKTLARSTTMLNRGSARSSPPILRRTNTSPTVRSSSAERNAPPLKGRSRGASVSPKLQAWQAPELGFSAEPPPNLRTSLDRPTSNSRNTLSRPRVGNYVEARHSYSEAIDGRQAHAIDRRHSHCRHSSSSASKFSSSTSQDRWSSRGSVISSSDDGTDVLEPSFLDFSVMSPSSTSGTGRTFTGRYDNEVSSRCSPVATRQRRSSTSSNLEAAGFSSASARKSLEPSMERVDHRRVSQTMFRPLLSSAPTTSFHNIGQTVVRHRPTQSFAEHSITASSNASSEKGVRIFPGNESSDDGEVEVGSEWDKNLPLGPDMSKFEVNKNDAIHEEYNAVHDHAVHYNRESVADSASCVMDVTVDGGANKTMYIDTPDWPAHKVNPEKNQINDETASQGGGESSSLPKSLINRIEHDSIDEKNGAGHPILLANNDQAFIDIQEDTPIQQKGSTWRYCESGNSQEFFHGPHKLELLNQGASPSFQEPLKPEHEILHEGTCKAVEESTSRSPQRNISTQVSLNTKKSPHGRKLDTEQPVVESITNARMIPTMSYHEDVSSHPQEMVDCALSTIPASLIDAEDCADGEQLQGADVPKIPMQEIRGSSAVDVVSLERLHVTKKTFFTSTTSSERVPSSAHLETEENPLPEIPTSIGMSNHHLSSQEEPGICPPAPSSQEQEGSFQQPELASQDSCREYYIDMPEIQANIHTREPKGSSFITSPRKLSYADSEGPFDSDKCSGKMEVDHSQVYVKAHAINMNEVGEQVKEVLSHDGHVQPAFSKDEHSSHGSVLMNELPLSSSQDLEGHVNVKENSINDLNQNIDVDADKSSEQCVVMEASAEASDEFDQLKLLAGDLTKTLVFSEDSSQGFNEKTWLPEVVSMQTDEQEPVLPANISQTVGEKDTGIQVNATLIIESQQQPHSTESSLKMQASPGWRPATPSFSLEEATNTILFCSSIVHDMVYKATSISTEKEVAKMAAAAPLSYQAKGHLSNAEFISSLRGKLSKSAARKGRSKDGKSLMKKPQGEDLAKPLTTITQHPTPIDGMEKGPAKVEEAEKAIADNSKEKSFMGMSVNSNCQCSVM